MPTVANLSHSAHRHAWNWTDLSNQRFTRLVALRPVLKPDRPKQSFWECLCDCGNTCVVDGSSLRTSGTKSCGCLKSNGRKIRDLTGQRFGKLVALQFEHHKGRRLRWNCLCDCGNTTSVAAIKLVNEEIASCGCARREYPKGTRFDLSGQRFGVLTVLDVAGRKGGAVLWNCICDCGNSTQVTAGRLSEKVKGVRRAHSCGCLNTRTKRERGVAAMSDLIAAYKRSAKSRQREWVLSDEEAIALFQSPCYYCGIAPCQTWPSHAVGIKSRFNGSVLYNGIDRADNLQGYLLNNCVAACGTCNKLKHRLSQDDFFAAISRIYEHWHTARAPKHLSVRAPKDHPIAPLMLQPHLPM